MVLVKCHTSIVCEGMNILECVCVCACVRGVCVKCVFNWVCACEIVKCSTIMCVHVKSVFKHVCVFVYVSVSENMCVCV